MDSGTDFRAIDVRRTRARPRPRIKPRGLPPALEAHEVGVARSKRDANRIGEAYLGEHRLTTMQDDEVAAAFHYVRIRDVSLGYFTYSAPVKLEIAELPDDYVVLVPANGSSVVSTRLGSVDASPVLAATPEPASALTLSCADDTAHLFVRIERAGLERHLGRLLGKTFDSPLRFDLPLDLSTGSATRWNFAVQMLHAELYEQESLLNERVGLGHLEEFLMSALLYTQSSNYSLRLRNETRVAGGLVRRASNFIESHLAEPFGVGDVASHLGVTTRTLQNHFGAQLGQTPIAYIRDRRLDRVRAELSDATPGAMSSVSETAERWGFTHLGRFASLYRTRFGELPSATLRA